MSLMSETEFKQLQATAELR